jgi:23S rRNA (uracil1939-C5)-methyltransferase
LDLNRGLDEADVGDLGQYDLVLMDPPRTGADDIAQELAESDDAPDEIIYVSCDPACFGRDIKYLSDGGWECSEINLLDMFPRTGHVEIVSHLSR